MKYAVVTFGCRVNQADSLGFEEQLRARGATADSADRADLVIVNTCSVTASADQSARQTVRRLLRSNPDAQVVVTGCYATRQPDEFRSMPNVVHVVPNDDKPRLIELLDGRGVRLEADQSTAQRFGDGEGSCGATIEPGVAGRTAFTLRVQTGCSQPCAYCIIPTTRGRPRSVPVDSVLAEIDRVASAGFREIALTGVHLGSYGRDLTPAASLIDLLRAIAVRLQGDLRLRISSLEPMDCSPGIVDLVAASDCFAPHFHLPLQHAGDRLLAAMRRPYTIGFYRALVDGIRARMPHASIGTDLIVGFPGERDEDFDELCAYLEGSPLTHLHVFPYSDRPGTAASMMAGKVHGGVIRARAARLREIGHRLTTAFRASQLGSVHRALTLEDGTLAVTGNYLKVRIPPGHARNEWLSIRVTAAGETMTGEIVE
jgi:threonylcarbamoyladenosine tRNA methylthiotransferase MtaB